MSTSVTVESSLEGSRAGAAATRESGRDDDVEARVAVMTGMEADGLMMAGRDEA